MKINSESIKDQIITDFTLMPDYHIEILGKTSYKKILTKSNWKRLDKRKLSNNEYIREFVYTEPDFSIIALSHNNNESIFDIQYEVSDWGIL